MKRFAIVGAVGLMAVTTTSAVAHFDHPAPSFSTSAPLSTALNAGGEEAEWELVATIPTGNPHTDLDFFTSGGETYASAGTLANGPNGGGQTIVKLTNQGRVEPSYVSSHPSASCLSAATGVTGLQHDVEAAPKGDVISASPNPSLDKRDAQLLVDSTDATGRCHDQGVLGASQVPQGGIEIIDVTNPAAPKEIGLTTHIGQAHTVNVDPKRPHIAFDVTQDGVSVGADGKRSNENSGNALDGFEIVDMSSCMNFPAGTPLQAKRDACRPQVYRYRYTEPGFATAHAFPNNLQSCHEVEIYPDDKLACASITASIVFDLAGAFDDRGTPNDFTDDKPRGTPLPCTVRDTSTVAPTFKTGAKVTDCAVGLTVKDWLAKGAPSLQGVRRIGTVHHMGFNDAIPQSATPQFDATEDVFASHEAELSGSRKFLLVTDERGGGIAPGGATCSPGADNTRGNGGVSAYPVDKLRTTVPGSSAEAQQAYAQTSDGERAIYRAQIRTGPQGSFCTSHVFQQIPGQNRIFMAWYSQGTQVVDFIENADGTIDFKEAGWFTPENANTWTSAIFKVQRNADGSFTYWGATGDFALAGVGRNAIDVYKVTLPAPPEPAGERQPGTPDFPVSQTRGVENPPGGATADPPTCAARAPLEAVSATPVGAGLRFAFTRRGGAPVTVELLRVSRGRTIERTKRAVSFGARGSSFRWRGSSKLPSGFYVARFTVLNASGGRDVRHLALRKSGRRWATRPDYDRRRPCELVEAFKVARPVFGGTKRRPLVVSYRLSDASTVSFEVRRGSRVVKRVRTRQARGNTNIKLNLGLGRAKRGDYKIVMKVDRPGRAVEAVIQARGL